jgi:hypothetical protein
MTKAEALVTSEPHDPLIAALARLVRAAADAKRGS